MYMEFQKALKIIIINTLPPSSGVGRYTLSVYNKIKFILRSSNNHTYNVLLANWSDINPKVKEIIQKSNNKNPSVIKHVLQMLRYLSLNFFLIKQIKCNNPILIHMTHPWIAHLLPLKNRYIVTVHDLFELKRITSIDEKLIMEIWTKRKILDMLRSSNYIICASESTKNDLLHYLTDIDSKKVKVIYYGVDHELFKPRDKLEARRRLGLPLDRPIILNVGSEEPRKNIPTLIKAFGILVKNIPNAMLIRVGSPTNTIKKLIYSQGLEGKIVYLRPTDEDLSLLYNASNVFVFPSYYEGLGLPLLEAMASSCPVIAGNRSAIPEAVGDGGILLDPFDIDGFAYWMHEVLLNEDLRIKLSEKGYRRSLNFSWEKCARETLEVYREVLNEV